MRKDIVKVYKEKNTSSDNAEQYHKKYLPKKVHPDDYDNEDLPAGLTKFPGTWNTPMGRRYNLLQKVLHKHIGRPWDKVYSELCATNTKKDFIAHEFQDVIERSVELHVEMVNGVPYTHKYGWFMFWGGYYVDPTTKLLCHKPEPKRRQRKKEEITEIRLEGGSCYKLENGLWFEVFGWQEYSALHIKYLGYTEAGYYKQKRSCGKKDLKIINDYIKAQK